MSEIWPDEMLHPKVQISYDSDDVQAIINAEKLALLDRIESEYEKEYLGQNQGQLYRSIIDQLRAELGGEG